jgi:Oxidoreductase family, NAD-binding Rossmann fold
MPESALGVGIVGVSPIRGWAAIAHIPALRSLPNYEIRALSAHNSESAHAAGEVFGVGAVFSDHQQLLTHPGIDVVAITVKVPHHRELVSAALAAGKAVYCEWPLGRDLDDARAMAALAAEQAAHTVVGLQARQAPVVEFVQELLRNGYVGEILSTTMVGLSVPGDVVGQSNAYMLDKATGAQPAHHRHRAQPGHPQLRTGRIRRSVGGVGPSQAAHHHRRDRGADRENGGRPDRGHRHSHVRSDRQRPGPGSRGRRCRVLVGNQRNPRNAPHHC